MNLNKLATKSFLWFFCNSCLAIRRSRVTSDFREGLNCSSCGLNSRQRAILLAAQRIKKADLFQWSKTKMEVLGVSDGAPIEAAFKMRFGDKYRNFEFHKEPFLDVTNVNDAFASYADIIICSKVLEHVKPPIDLAFSGLFKLLRPGGKLILSVPHRGIDFAHEEHFRILRNSSLELGPQVLKGIDPDGNEREFFDLVFHGGAGATLEYRVFSESSVQFNLMSAGFTKIQSQSDCRLFACLWEPWSRVWIAQKPI